MQSVWYMTVPRVLMAKIANNLRQRHMWGDLMSGRNALASILTACSLTVGFGGVAPEADAASAGQSVLKSGESARNDVTEIKYRGRGPRFYLPIAPSYLAYDYPYYYSRGHYPTHIRPGYVYYGYRLSTTPNAPIGTGYAAPIAPSKKAAKSRLRSVARR